MSNSLFWFLFFFIPVMGMFLGALAAEEVADHMRKRKKKQKRQQKTYHVEVVEDDSPISYIKCLWR